MDLLYFCRIDPSILMSIKIKILTWYCRDTPTADNYDCHFWEELLLLIKDFSRNMTQASIQRMEQL